MDYATWKFVQLVGGLLVIAIIIYYAKHDS